MGMPELGIGRLVFWGGEIERQASVSEACLS